MLRHVLAAICAVSVISMATGSFASTESEESCVGFEKNEDEKSIVYQAKNSCDEKLACRLSWVVECEDNEGKVTQRTKKSASFALGASGEHSLSLSAEQCKQGWAIDEVSWSCKGAR